MITIYTIAYNESLFLQFMIDHYRSRFPGCHIVVYDNYSTDNTVEIAKANNCYIRYFNTNNQINDLKYLEVKNHVWKQALTDWVLVCDVDELVDISEQTLKEEERLGSTVIKFAGYNMVNMSDNLDISSIKYGVRSLDYDKRYLFNKKFVEEINYKPGCHQAEPTGHIVVSDKNYLAYHYKYFNLDYLVARHKLFSSRLSSINKENYWGNSYQYNEIEITALFQLMRDRAKQIIP
jgi:glycosyltransferase involved in cell wall biosynthesis